MGNQLQQTLSVIIIYTRTHTHADGVCMYIQTDVSIYFVYILKCI